MDNQFSIQIKNSVEQIKEINNFISELSQKFNFTESLQYNLELCVEELVSNIINYAYSDTTGHNIQLDFIVSEKVVQITITDNGLSFNPLEVDIGDELDKSLEERSVGGLGIYFVKQLATHLAYERKNDVNCITMEFSKS